MVKTKTKPRFLTEKDKFAERLKKARLANGFTQQAVADRSVISRSAIVSYELGKVVPGALELIRLSKALQVSPNYLLTGSENFFGPQGPKHFLSVEDPRLRAAIIGICLDVLDQEVVDNLSSLIVNLVRAKFPQKAQYDAFVNTVIQGTNYIKEALPALDMMSEQTIQVPVIDDRPARKRKPGHGK